jgi:hypothetical protein
LKQPIKKGPWFIIHRHQQNGFAAIANKVTGYCNTLEL